MNLITDVFLAKDKTISVSCSVLTSGCLKCPQNFSYHCYSGTCMWMYSSDTPYRVQLFVPPLWFALQFLLTLVPNFFVFIFQTLSYVHFVSFGTGFISRKICGMSEHKSCTLARHNTQDIWPLTILASTPRHWQRGTDAHSYAGGRPSGSMQAARRLLLIAIMCNQVRRFDPLCAWTPWHQTEPSLQPCHSQTLPYTTASLNASFRYHVPKHFQGLLAMKLRKASWRWLNLRGMRCSQRWGSRWRPSENWCHLLFVLICRHFLRLCSVEWCFKGRALT
jgi:hypothetical protein